MKIMIRDPYRIFIYSLQIKKTKQEFISMFKKQHDY